METNGTVTVKFVADSAEDAEEFVRELQRWIDSQDGVIGTVFAEGEA